jgi:uncharacterized protein (DUF2252 family)
VSEPLSDLVKLRRPSLDPPANLRRLEGKAIRRQLPRSWHATWAPKAERPDPVVLLQRADRGRLKSLLPLRYGRMLASPAAFLRGAASVMARDLSDTPVTGLRGWICGDAHLDNFGGYATPERNFVFDLNDFDEAFEGPWEWDVKRLAASLVTAARVNGTGEHAYQAIALACVRSYRKRMRELAKMRFLDAWYSRLDADDAVERFDDGRVIAQADRAEHRRTNVGSLPTLTVRENGGYRIIDEPPLISHTTQSLGNRLPTAWAAYRATLFEDRRLLLDRYQIEDVARKVVCVGSVGLRNFVLLLLGNDDEDPLFLQLKEARPSVLEPLIGRSSYNNQGRRVVSGQRILQAASDLFLGWTRIGRVDYYVRQLRDMKFAVPTAELGTDDLTVHGELCGWVLARAHACSSDPARIAGYLGRGEGFDRAVAKFAIAYADQTERDFATLEAAVRAGRLPAERGL